MSTHFADVIECVVCHRATSFGKERKTLSTGDTSFNQHQHSTLNHEFLPRPRRGCSGVDDAQRKNAETTPNRERAEKCGKFSAFHTIKLILSEWCDVHGVFLFITVCICSLTTLFEDEEVGEFSFEWNEVLTGFLDSNS